MAKAVIKDKSLESWIWDAACSIRSAKDAPLSSTATTRVGPTKATVDHILPQLGI